MDFGTDDGLFIGRIQAAVAAKESATKSRRIKRKNEERAAEGKPHGGSTRPFGFEDDRVTHNRPEVTIIRQLAARFLAGESWGSLVRWLTDTEVPTVNGGTWRTHTVRQMIAAPRTAGLRSHCGEIVGPGTWKPIITPADRDRILALIDSKKVSGRRSNRSYLLGGHLRCGRCDNVLYSARRKTTRRYVCSSGPDHGGCGGLSVVADPVEELIVEAVLLRLDTPQLADALTGRNQADEDSTELMTALDADRGRLLELSGLYAENQIEAPEWMEARGKIETRIRKTQKRLAQRSSHSDLAAVIGKGSQLRSEWSALTLGRQTAIVKAVVAYVTILPGTLGARSLDPNRVVPVWRL